MTINGGSARLAHVTPGALISGGPSDHAGEAPTASRQHAFMLVGMAAVARLPRDRRFQRHVAMIVIGLAAVAGIAREGRVSSFGRLAAWDKRRNLRYLRTAKARQP